MSIPKVDATLQEQDCPTLREDALNVVDDLETKLTSLRREILSDLRKEWHNYLTASECLEIESIADGVDDLAAELRAIYARIKEGR